MTLTNKLLRIALLLSLLLAVEGIAAKRENIEEKHAKNLLKEVERVLGGEKVWSAFDSLVSQDSDSSEWKEVARANLDIVVDKPEDIWAKVKEAFEGVAKGKLSGPFSREEPYKFGSSNKDIMDIQWFRVRPVSSKDLKNLQAKLQSALSELEKSRGQDVLLDTTKRSAQVRDTLKKNVEKDIASCLEPRTKLPFVFIFNTQVKGIQRVLKHTFSPEDLYLWSDEGAASEDIQKKFQFEDYYRVSPDVWENSEESKKSLEALKTFGGESKSGRTVKALPSMRCNPVTGELTFFLKEGTTTKEGWDELLKVFVEQIFSSRSNRPR